MEIKINQVGDLQIAEIISDNTVIANAEDGLDLVGNLYFQGLDNVILYEKNITPDFFQLKTGIAGEILQKFSTYRITLAIVGNFDAYSSKSMQDFIFESNKFGRINFVGSRPEAIEKLTKKG